ncbi:TetR/AcrR family transcriptional regulator [Nocardioides sp. R-C-SC26]|uniref:TetR/AcrR family transcriptional regulator n=1 Tax=Nocardioides sp. R-C-SC26 TaxID=2870414 RepID=UPI001E2ECBC7|nr:TetR/AcrR family transcriptional regulator [Nocardioides sp. R-C-SC26]
MPATRSSYHHGDLRAALVAAGVDVVRERGPDALAVRELARRVGVSHNAAYRHFANRDELVAAVAQVALVAMTRAGEERLDAIQDPDPRRRARRRLHEVGRSYVDYALAEPGLFRVAFAAYPSQTSESAGPAALDDELAVAGPFLQLCSILDELAESGFLAAEARPGAEFVCWAAVHGQAMLFLEGPLQGLTDAERRPLVEALLRTVDRSYGATSGDVSALD